MANLREYNDIFKNAEKFKQKNILLYIMNKIKVKNLPLAKSEIQKTQTCKNLKYRI